MKHALLTLIALFTVTSISAQTWNTYPYEPAGTALTFPADEGYHPGEPVEWWYTVGHVTGDVTGDEYSYMLTYFYYPSFGFDGFRILNLANDETGEFFPEMAVVNYPTLSTDHLEIEAQQLLGATEIWETRRNGNGDLIPFSYHIESEQPNGSINLDYVASKRPLIVNGDGLFDQGLESYTYYYSQTMLDVEGSITFDGFTESVSGIAWIDRQWGSMNPSPTETDEQYEWFCVQLDNGMDLNIWNIFDADGMIPDTSTYRLVSIYANGSTDIHSHDFTMHRTAYSYLPDSSRVYSQQWNFVLDDIDLVITTLYNNSEVTLPFRFYEGTTTVTGTVGGVTVTGVGFAELLHDYDIPEMQLTFPTESGYWAGTDNITWELLNPDGGREVYYDVEYSLDNKVTYNLITSNLTETMVEWDGDGIAFGTECWIRITGYSVDQTLIGTHEMDGPFTFGYVGIDEQNASDIHVLIYPNPSSEGTVTIQFDGEPTELSSIEMQDVGGRTIIRKEIEKSVSNEKFLLDVSEIPSGMYLINIQLSDWNQVVRKFFLEE